MPHFFPLLLIFILWVPSLLGSEKPDSFKVMSYNIHGYLTEQDSVSNGFRPKSEKSKAQLQSLLLEEVPDILGLIEMGNQATARAFQADLKKSGLSYPHMEWIEGVDTIHHLCILSRFPIAERDPHLTETFTVEDRSMRPLRGFLEVDVKPRPDYQVKIYLAHLKSKRPSDDFPVDPSQFRLGEARLLRKKIDEDIRKNKKLNLLVMGDLNDEEESPPLQALLKHARHPLLDLCPVNAYGYTGTYYFFPKKEYERIDYMLVNDDLKKEYIAGSASLRDDPVARKASDHFPIQARFKIGDQ